MNARMPHHITTLRKPVVSVLSDTQKLILRRTTSTRLTRSARKHMHQNQFYVLKGMCGPSLQQLKDKNLIELREISSCTLFEIYRATKAGCLAMGMTEKEAEQVLEQ